MHTMVYNLAASTNVPVTLDDLIDNGLATQKYRKLHEWSAEDETIVREIVNSQMVQDGAITGYHFVVHHATYQVLRRCNKTTRIDIDSLISDFQREKHKSIVHATAFLADLVYLPLQRFLKQSVNSDVIHDIANERILKDAHSRISEFLYEDVGSTEYGVYKAIQEKSDDQASRDQRLTTVSIVHQSNINDMQRHIAELQSQVQEARAEITRLKHAGAAAGVSNRPLSASRWPVVVLLLTLLGAFFATNIVAATFDRVYHYGFAMIGDANVRGDVFPTSSTFPALNARNA